MGVDGAQHGLENFALINKFTKAGKDSIIITQAW